MLCTVSESKSTETLLEDCVELYRYVEKEAVSETELIDRLNNKSLDRLRNIVLREGNYNLSVLRTIIGLSKQCFIKNKVNEYVASQVDEKGLRRAIKVINCILSDAINVKYDMINFFNRVKDASGVIDKVLNRSDTDIDIIKYVYRGNSYLEETLTLEEYIELYRKSDYFISISAYGDSLKCLYCFSNLRFYVQELFKKEGLDYRLYLKYLGSWYRHDRSVV